MATIKNSKKQAFLPLLMAISLAVGLLVGVLMTNERNPDSEVSRITRRYKEILNLIEGEYVDSVDLKITDEAAITTLLQQLDPHTRFIPKSDKQIVDAQLESGFDGIGIEFQIIQDTLWVTGVIKDGPSSTAGLQNGDKIITVNSDTIAGKGIEIKDVFRLLRGQKNSEVNINVLRYGVNELLPYKIIRGTIPTSSIDAAYVVNDSIGYIKLSRFAENTYNEFYESLQDLNDQGIKGLILDLRGNGGGFLHQATLLLEEFLLKGSVMVFTKGKNPASEYLYKVTKGGVYQDKPLAILVDEYSASASEIVSGALQDNDRAWIVGRRTFGKGLVQSSYDLIDGSVLRLTISRYYTPSGRCIQRPYTSDAESYESELLERYESGELFYQDSIPYTDSLKYKTVGGRNVYGGGGIIPDVFVPKDTATNYLLFNHLMKDNLIRTYSIRYSLKYNDYLVKMGIEQFLESFVMDDQAYSELIELAKSKEIFVHEKEIKASRKTINKHFKAFLAKNVWGEGAYYKAINFNDDFITSSIDKLQREPFIKEID